VPQVSELATALAARDVHLEPFPLTVDDAVQALRPIVIGEPPVLDAPPTPEPLFDVRGLSYHYPGTDQKVVRDVSLTLGPRQVTAIAGGNGAGKSTLARLLARILSPPPDRIWLCGDDLSRLSQADVASRVGYVFQYPEHQFIGQTALDDVLFGLRRAGVPESEARARALDMLTEFGLMPLAAAHPFTLSHGEQRRLSVAAMLVLDQRALLMDEPTFGQDRRNHTLLLDRLSALAGAGRAIVAITHDMRLVAERASRVLAMADGELIFDGTPRELFANRLLLDRARLRPPPVWELGQRLGVAEPFLSVADAQARLTAR
jgi:energy-coupling factor transport system ATP-binding protein